MAETKYRIDEIPVVYVPGQTHVISFLHPETRLSIYMGTPEAELLAENPGAKVYDKLDDVTPLIQKAEDEKYIDQWKEITEKEYWYYLEVLPPKRYERGPRGIDSFLMTEYWTSNITQHVFRFGKRYFAARRRDTDKREDLIAEIQKQFKL